MRKRGKIGGEEDRILHALFHIYSFKNKQIYFNHFNHKDEKRWKDRQKNFSPIFVDHTVHNYIFPVVMHIYSFLGMVLKPESETHSEIKRYGLMQLLII